jgi:hypothetical protein
MPLLIDIWGIKVNILNRLSFTSLLVALSGCATIIEPPKQTISINSDPPGVSCDVTREGKSVANLVTPGIFTVEKSRSNLIIRCQKYGFTSITGVDKSHNKGWIFGNIVFGGLVGTIVDLSTSADDVYGETIKIKLKKLQDSNENINDGEKDIFVKTEKEKSREEFSEK